jgi:hypothetical protein
MFNKKKLSKTTTYIYNKRLDAPNGLSFQVDDQYFLVKSGTAMRFFSKRVFQSWGLIPVVVSAGSIAHLKSAGVIGFRDGSLVKNFVDGKMYLVSDNKRRLIKDPDLVTLFGQEVITASEAEIKLHDEGEPLDAV